MQKNLLTQSQTKLISADNKPATKDELQYNVCHGQLHIAEMSGVCFFFFFFDFSPAPKCFKQTLHELTIIGPRLICGSYFLPAANITAILG